ncbi:MAG: hypothetical protein E6I18_10310 [Chloroflexi bacterium]|nr:MAG: hypothetical protein E6I18_10310 [Chloroflexota bacterium]
MVFAGAIGIILLLVTLTRGGETPTPRNAPAPNAQTSQPPSVAPPTPGDLNSEWVSQSPSPTIAVGAETALTFNFRNTGKVAWVRGAASEARLGYVTDGSQFDDRMAIDWANAERPAVQTEAVVPPGQVATFTFKIRGVTPGTFRLNVRPVVDGIAWLPDQGVYIEVTVR